MPEAPAPGSDFSSTTDHSRAGAAGAQLLREVVGGGSPWIPAPTITKRGSGRSGMACVASWAIAFQNADILTVAWPGQDRQPHAEVAAVERAAAVLGALAEGGELGTNEGSHEGPASTPARCPASSPRSSMPEWPSTSSRPAATGWGSPPRQAQERRARPARSARGRPPRTCARSSRRPARRPPSPRRATRTRSPWTSSRALLRSERGPAGATSVAHATATGKVALAFGDVALPPGRLRAFTARTIVDRGGSRTRDRARPAGRAGRRPPASERTTISAVAAPVRGSRGELAVIGIQGPGSRFDAEALARAIEPLLARAAAVSDASGWRPTAKEGL